MENSITQDIHKYITVVFMFMHWIAPWTYICSMVGWSQYGEHCIGLLHIIARNYFLNAYSVDTVSSVNSWLWQEHISMRSSAVWLVPTRLIIRIYVSVYARAETACVSGSTYMFMNFFYQQYQLTCFTSTMLDWLIFWPFLTLSSRRAYVRRHKKPSVLAWGVSATPWGNRPISQLHCVLPSIKLF